MCRALDAMQCMCGLRAWALRRQALHYIMRHVYVRDASKHARPVENDLIRSKYKSINLPPLPSRMYSESADWHKTERQPLLLDEADFFVLETRLLATASRLFDLPRATLISLFNFSISARRFFFSSMACSHFLSASVQSSFFFCQLLYQLVLRLGRPGKLAEFVINFSNGSFLLGNVLEKAGPFFIHSPEICLLLSQDFFEGV
mmetsp:Transcript_13942/g.26620  ORF Transcript_13942/g.26620 Transcript_13942/m.26620 type:complete len:203 (+) Transcript_13942:11-619(+)